MRIDGLKPANDQDLYWSFVLAESESPRYGAGVRSRLNADTLSKIRTGSRLEMTPEDWASVQYGLSHRLGYIARATMLNPRWWTGSIRVLDLPEVSVIKMDEFDAIAPSRRLGDFVSAVDAGKFPTNDFKQGWDALRPNYNAKLTRGFPILLSEVTEGPYVEMEGLTRMSCLVSMSRAKEPVPESIPVLLGETARLSEWDWYPW